MTKTTKSSWQNAHPWYMDATKGSNMASDNTRSMKDIFSGKKVAVFGVPAPYTGVCTEEHVPGYKTLADDFKGKGVDSIICYAVGCPYAQYAWAKNMDALGKIEFLSDVDGSWAKEFGLDKDYSAVSLGVRSERFSMLVEDGEVKKFQIVEDAKKDASVLLKQA